MESFGLNGQSAENKQGRDLLLLRSSFKTFFTVLGANNSVNASPHIKISFDFHPAGTDGLYQIIEDLIGHFFVKGAFIAVAPKVKLETL